MPKADTATFPELHVTSLQGSKTEYFNAQQLTKLSNINMAKPQFSLLKYGGFYLVSW